MKIRKQSLHTKIVFWSTSVVGIILLVFSIESILLIRNKLRKDIDRRLASETEEIIHTFDFIDGKIQIIHPFEWEEPHHTSEEDAVYILYTDIQKIELGRSKNYIGKTSPLSTFNYDSLNTRFDTQLIDEQNIRFSIMPIRLAGKHRGWAITGMTFESLNHVQSVIIGVYAVIFPLAMIIAFLGSSVIARKAMAPVLDISETVRNIHARNLDKTLPELETKDEIAHLADTINDLLERLRKSFKTIRQFTANASHELKIPLSIVQAELEQVQKSNSASKNKPSLERTKIELNRMAKLIDDLSTLAKADTHQIILSKKAVWLNDIIHDEIERYRHTANQKNICLKPIDLPSVSIQADAHWMQVLVSNILDNGIKFSPRNSTVTVQIIEENNRYFHLVFSDEGPGILEHEVELITQRFYRSEPANKIAGSGLGLSIVQWVAEAHGGKLRFENNIDKGLTVTASIPV